jgi:putative acetyltransferase
MSSVRLEEAHDVDVIRRIHLAAFETSLEADLVDQLRESGKLLVSMVAQHQRDVVGHIAFSRVLVDAAARPRGVGLGPVAVEPRLQRQGIGSLLVRAGLNRCRQLQYDFAVVLGHAAYYPRFGFAPASRFQLRCTWDVPDEVFMALELREGALRDVSGLVTYEPEFSRT